MRRCKSLGKTSVALGGAIATYSFSEFLNGLLNIMYVCGIGFQQVVPIVSKLGPKQLHPARKGPALLRSAGHERGTNGEPQTGLAGADLTYIRPAAPLGNTPNMSGTC